MPREPTRDGSPTSAARLDRVQLRACEHRVHASAEDCADFRHGDEPGDHESRKTAWLAREKSRSTTFPVARIPSDVRTHSEEAATLARLRSGETFTWRVRARGYELASGDERAITVEDGRRILRATLVRAP